MATFGAFLKDIKKSNQESNARKITTRDDRPNKKAKVAQKQLTTTKSDSKLATTSTTNTVVKSIHQLPHTEPKPVTFPHKYILAPMVGASELAFRLLCRKYGAQASYTPMMSAEQFAHSEEYRTQEFQTCSFDRPLVCHFAANHPTDFAEAARLAEPYCDAIDLNLGCPQRTAYLGHFGSYLLDPKDRTLLCDIISAANRAVEIPIFVKIRLLDTLEETILLCQQLRKAGASLIAIHARYRASWERKGPGARDGPALLEQITEIRKHVTDIPIIANGNVVTFADVQNNLEFTGANGVMSAEGILDNPALFLPRYGTDPDTLVTTHVLAKQPIDDKLNKLQSKLEKIRAIEQKAASKGIDSISDKEKKKLTKKEKTLKSIRKRQKDHAGSTIEETTVTLRELQRSAEDNINLAFEYLNLASVYPVKIRSVIFHIRRMIKEQLVRYQHMEDCLACENIDQVRQILQKIETYRSDPVSFIYDMEKAKNEKEALERKRHEEGKRKRYEERMIRKAKREGKKDLNFYLQIGAEVPTREKIKRLKGLTRGEQLSIWKEDHSQHCLSFHLDPEGCKRDRACAFLHVDILGRNGFDEKDAVAG